MSLLVLLLPEASPKLSFGMFQHLGTVKGNKYIEKVLFQKNRRYNFVYSSTKHMENLKTTAIDVS